MLPVNGIIMHKSKFVYIIYIKLYDLLKSSQKAWLLSEMDRVNSKVAAKNWL